jgi:hypothetical protein
LFCTGEQVREKTAQKIIEFISEKEKENAAKNKSLR